MEHEYKHLIDIVKKYKIIHVPYYQREYVWGKSNNGRNLYKFIDDIFNQYASNPESDYFIGTLAFCSEKSRNGNDVIDGQQRITSLILVLSVLANFKCSDEIRRKHQNFLFPLKDEPGQFILQENHYLTEEIKCYLGFPNNFDTQGEKADISRTIDKITSQIRSQWNDYTTSWYDGLYNYIFNRISFIWLEYSTIGESLKYFLNINSLSIPLTQSDIFFSILSEAIRISECTEKTIYNLKEDIAKTASTYNGLGETIKGYKAYDRDSPKGIDNLIYIFVNAYYKNDNNIDQLNDAGVGKWMSIYKNNVFRDSKSAYDFVTNFVTYLNDVTTICKYFENENGCISEKTSSIYTSSIFIRYTKYSVLLGFLISLFRDCHNYQRNSLNLYTTSENHKLDSTNLDMYLLDDMAKRLNLTLLSNYIQNEKDLLRNLDVNIERNDDGNFAKRINDIIRDMEPLESICNLEYNDGGVDGTNRTSPNDKDYIKMIFACQEAFLNSIASREQIRKDINEYLAYILDGENFSIEHIYSRNEFANDNRREAWNRIHPDRFDTQQDFDTERFSFLNLSLLDRRNNSAAKDKEIGEKLNIYRNAMSFNDNEYEYLIQSLVRDSAFYSNEEIQNLHLPDRAIEINQNTWEHSPNNQEFNIELLKMALKEIADKSLNK